jgi:hypothetical protein
MPQEALNSCEHAAEGMDGSDPLVSKAQELVAAAAACTTPGVHAPLSDSAALLNSGAVLLLGQGSTTMYGTNTAASVEASPGGTILSPDECRSHVLSSPQHTSALQQASPAAQRPQQQQQRSPAACRRAASRASRRRANRRRQGLLVDSQAGMQQLVAAVQASQHSQQEDKPDMHAELSLQPPQQQQQQQQSAVLSGLQGLSVKQSEDDSQSVPASGDVLVLGVSCTSSRADATPAAADATQGAVPPAEGEAADAAGDGAGRGGGHAATAAQPVLQLLSCSSLNSNPPAGRSNSSLFHLNLSNCSFMRLGSFTGTHSFAGTHTSSFSSNDSFSQSRPGSFTGQHTSTAAAGGALQSPGPAAGPASRPSPLPMLHESCSWGKNLDAADRRAGQQQAAPVRRQQAASPADSQHQQLLRQQQLIYLLD